MQPINHITSSLETQLQLLHTADLSGAQLSLGLGNALELLAETKVIARHLNNQMLNDFLNANHIILAQLQNSTADLKPEDPILSKSNEIMLQLTHMYQDAIVPLLTRLHNLTNETDDMQKITAITSLGNEINTCSGQINQFSDKFNLTEKICTMFGIILMLSSISMLVAILSKPTIEIPVLTPLTVMGLGCSLCKHVMDNHRDDPGSDLITTSIKKIEPLIYDVAKNFAHDSSLAITEPHTTHKSTAKKTVKPKKVVKAEEDDKKHQEDTTPEVVEEIQIETETIEQNVSGSFLEKIKGVLDIFTSKK